MTKAKNTPIILDRLSAALAQQGVVLKRQQLLTVASSAFGYRDDNAFSSADKAGDISIERAQPLGTDEHGLAVMRDPRTGGIFAFEATDGRARAGKWCVSPYGGLLDVSHVPMDGTLPPVQITLHTAIVSHRHGTNFYTSLTAEGLDAEIAGYCDDWWSEARQHDEDLPETTEGMSNDEIASTYFEAVEEEYVERSTDELTLPAALSRVLRSPTGEAWIIGQITGEADEPIMWWNDNNGWGNMETAQVYADRNGRLPVVGIDVDKVFWQRLPEGFVEERAGKQPLAVDAWERAEPTEKEAQTGALVVVDRIEAVKGVTFGILNVERQASDRHVSGWRKRVVIQTVGEYDADAARLWAEETGLTIGRAQGVVEVAEGRARVLFEGDAGIGEAGSPADWLHATRDLLMPLETRERIIADFTPEAWIRDHAVPVDDEGEGGFDVTYEMLLMGREAAMELDSTETDHLLEAVRAPDWIRSWNGPFTIRVHDAVEESGLFVPEE